jgi:putative restriction endonuclease
VLLVWELSTGTTGFHKTLLRHHGTQVRKPQRSNWAPDPAHLDWHGREIFKGAARYLPSG